jgi:hypothetical protein
MSQTGAEETQFDFVEIGALNLAFEVKQWINEITPQPSEALQNLVESHPISIIAKQGGTQWYIRPADGRSPVPIDAAKFPVQPADLKSAEGFLNIAYLVKWISCIRSAVDGSASEASLNELRKLAEAEKEPTRTILLANLGARVIALSPRNPEWLAVSRLNSDAVSGAFSAYRKLENEKALAAVQFRNGNQSLGESGPTNIVSISEAFSDVDWSYFESAVAQPQKHTGALTNRIVTWNFNKEGKLVSNNDQTEPIVNAVGATYVLTPDQHIILIGDVNNEKVEAIQGARSLADLLSTSKRYDLKAFFSTPGSSILMAVH